MPRVVHFEIHADNPKRACDFYKSIFGWEITKWEGAEDYWLIKTGEAPELGIDGAIMRRQQWVTGKGVNAYVCTVDVTSIEEAAIKVTKAGGKIIVPKMEIPQIGFLVYCEDTEGNMFGMMQSIVRT